MSLLSKAAIGLLFVIGAVSGSWLHEGAHWVVGKLFRSGPEIQVENKIVAMRVTHQELRKQSLRVIQFLGAAPLLYWIPLLPLLTETRTIQRVVFEGMSLGFLSGFKLWLLFSLSFAVIGFTFSDYLAIFAPEEFIDREEQDNFPRQSGYPYLFNIR